ncbi:hypothetical protein [Armatimonas rosea]|uniref:Uncharacterized protein n=1 Tax=Armatimonas rosea TaxID=685828 RepID=A0A7W9W8J9_ARMRO|nr:hypothetical protein [Armatimonas rosea]MBB6052321.1 hypothetical protein [Armatimonas rosea]
MPRFTVWLPAVGSTLLLLIALRGARAGFSPSTSHAPRTPVDQQFIQCSTVLMLLEQGRSEAALRLLERQSHLPLHITKETPLSSEVSPATQVILLCQDLIKEAEQAKAKGQPDQAKTILRQCKTLSHRIRVTDSESELHRQVATALDRMTSRAETLLLTP